VADWLYETRLGRLSYACLAAVVTLAAWAASRWLDDVPTPLSWVGIALSVVAWMASWVALLYFIGAILGPRFEIDMSADGEGD
jgi:hypothetical protein